MFASSKRYGFNPASLHVVWKSGSCVLGVHDATTIRFKSCSLIISFSISWASLAHIYRLSAANTTFGSVFAYSATAGTSTTPPMLMPQWHTKTPTLGVSPISLSSGYVTSLTIVPRTEVSMACAIAAAPDACATEVGISFGSCNVPHTKTPGMFDSTGDSSAVATFPNRSSFIPDDSSSSLTGGAI